MTDRLDILTVYQAVDGWRWKLQSGGNYRVIDAGTESYVRRIDCISNAARVLDLRDSTAAFRRGHVNRLWQPHLRVVVKP